jgi:D-glycero-D-manno-heptose 1,7-bisphosphate phosphatase
MRRAVFFDRDGVINDDKEYYYVTNPDMFHINPGVINLMKHVREKGFLSIVITNQAGVNKGLYSKEDVEAIHQKMLSILAEHGLSIDEIYYCTHHPDLCKCICRKPDTLFIEKAISRFTIAPSVSYFIGDRDTDMEAGHNAGLKSIKVERNGNFDYLIDLIE